MNTTIPVEPQAAATTCYPAAQRWRRIYVASSWRNENTGASRDG